MKSDEGIFKMLSKSSIIRNQYENVIPHFLKYILKGHLKMAFFLFKVESCQKDIAVNHLKTLVLKKNLN